jgi:hypothetical protein
MVDRHPNEDDLFLLADGGIGPLKAWMLRLHLKRCWFCRRVVDDHRRAMHALVEHRERVRRGTAHLDAEMKARFARRLTQVAGEEPALIAPACGVGKRPPHREPEAVVFQGGAQSGG